jgi:eukaryotic-like serine/threonine-protein kinase
MARDEMNDRLLVEWEAAIDRFERAWQLGERPSIRGYCCVEGPHAESLLKELVLIDCEHRFRVGEPRGADDYLREFPECRDDQDLIFNLLKLESRWNARGPVSGNGHVTRPLSEPERSPSDASSKAVELPVNGSSTALPAHADTVRPPQQPIPGDHNPPGDSLSKLTRNTPWGAVSAGLGRFRLLEMIGQGSFGSVYRAMDMKLGRLVALKLPRKEILATDADRERFLREAQSAAGLRHPNIVPVYEVGGARDYPFIVSAFINGQTLAEELSRRRFDFSESAQIARAMADALQYAHDRLIVHRDVKPSNIMLEADGQPLLMDFGVAKREGDAVLTDDGQLLGTPAYMSPEQAAGGGARVDRRSDIYSVGVVLYELMTGERPFKGSVKTVLNQVFDAEPRSPRLLDPRVPRDLTKICLKCLRKLPEDRYQTAKQVSEDLSKFLRGEPVHVTAISPLVIGWRWARNRPKTAGAISLVLILAASLPFVLSRAEERVHNAERETEENIRLANEAKISAEESQDASRESLEKSFILKGNTVLESDDPSSALSWFANGIERSPTSLRHAANRVRLMTTLAHVPRAVGLWVDQGSIACVAQSPTQPLLAVATTCQLILHDLSKPRSRGQILLDKTMMKQCVFSPDGKRLAANSSDGKLRIWAMSNLGRRPPMELSQGELAESIAFDSKGRFLASACDESGVQLLDVENGTLQATALSPPAIVLCVAFNSDASLLAMSGRDGSVRLWSVATRKSYGSPMTHRGRVNCVSFTSDGQSLVSASDDASVRIWDVATGTHKYVFPLGSPVECIALHPNGNLLAAGCNNGHVEAWNLKDGHQVPGDFRHERTVFHVAFAASGQNLLTTSADGTARVWDLRTGKPAALPVFHRAAVIWAEVAHEGKQILTACTDGLIRRWRFDTPFTAEVRSHHSEPIGRAALSSDERWLLLTREDGPVELCDLSNPELILRDVGHGAAVRNGIFSPGGRSLVTISKPGTLEIRDVSSPDEPLESRNILGLPHDVAFSPNGRLLVASGSDGVPQILSISDKTFLRKLSHEPVLKRAFFSPDSQKIYVVGDRSVCVWNAASGTRMFELPEPFQIDDCCLTPDKRFLIMRAHFSATVCDAKSGAVICRAAHRDLVTNIALNADTKRLITASRDGTARVWNIPSGEPVTGPLDHGKEVTWCAFRPDGLLVATASADKTARVWDARTGEPASPPLQHTDRVIFVAFRKGGKELVSVSVDGLIRTWILDDDSSDKNLLRRARVTCGQRVNQEGVANPLKPLEIRQDWDELTHQTSSASR